MVGAKEAYPPGPPVHGDKERNRPSFEAAAYRASVAFGVHMFAIGEEVYAVFVVKPLCVFRYFCFLPNILVYLRAARAERGTGGGAGEETV